LQVSFVFTRTRLTGIKKFYEIGDITTINWKKVYPFLGEKTRVKKDRAYTTEEIQHLLVKADERMRVVILLLASTGMRIGAIPDLKLRHLIRNEKYNLYQIVVYENSNEEYYTFCSPECAAAIDSYLEYRQRYNEKLTADSPLIRDNFNRRDSKRSKNAKQISLNSLFWLLSDLLKSSGVQRVEHAVESKNIGRIRKDVMRAHGFRKFVETNMIRSKVNPEAREMLLGHSIGLSNSYYKPDANEILEEYLKAVNLLTINEENRLRIKLHEKGVQYSREYELLRQELDDFKKEFKIKQLGIG
jgi:integrase